MKDKKTSKEVSKPKVFGSPISLEEDGSFAVTSVEGKPVFGSRDEDFIAGISHDIIGSSKMDGEIIEHQLRANAAFVEGLKPRDQIEAMLATQMTVTHRAVMRASRMFNGASTLEQVGNAERAMNKLARTFTTQMDALKRYRSEQAPVKVRDVNVADGGQAIVGNVTKGAGGNDKS